MSLPNDWQREIQFRPVTKCTGTPFQPVKAMGVTPNGPVGSILGHNEPPVRPYETYEEFMRRKREENGVKAP